MSLPQGGFQRREDDRWRPLVWGGFALIAIVVWGWIVITWNDGKEAGVGGTEAGREADESATARAGGSGGVDSEVPESIGEVPVHPAYATTPEPVSPAGGDEQQEQHAHSNRHLGGATQEPGSYDPLGTGASPTDLSSTDKERVRHAAEKFVMAAYGYTGDDVAEYLAGVSSVSLAPDLSLSEGGPEISRYREQVEATGTKGAARLSRLDIESMEIEEVVGYAYFETGEGYDSRTGKLTGERIAYRQEMTFSRISASWKVKATGEVEEV